MLGLILSKAGSQDAIVMAKCSPTPEHVAPAVEMMAQLQPDKETKVIIESVSDLNVSVWYKKSGIAVKETIPKSNVRFDWKCTSHSIRQAKEQGRSSFPGKMVTKLLEEKNPVLKTSPESVAYLAHFLTRRDVSQQHLESSWKPKNKNIKWRLLQTPYKLYGRLRSEMIEEKLKPISWTSFWKVVCKSGEYEVLTADNCCCATCRDLGFYNFKAYVELLDEIEKAIMNASHLLLLQRCEAGDTDVWRLKDEYITYEKEISSKIASLKSRVDKQVCYLLCSSCFEFFLLLFYLFDRRISCLALTPTTWSRAVLALRTVFPTCSLVLTTSEIDTLAVILARMDKPYLNHRV